LLEAPLWQLFARRRYGAVLEVMNEFKLCAHGLHRVTIFAIENEDAENVIRIAGSVLNLIFMKKIFYIKI
jgi:hypothetical protein